LGDLEPLDHQGEEEPQSEGPVRLTTSVDQGKSPRRSIRMSTA
jgi:hypothetical protein